VDESYYAALYADGKTAEWCMTEDHDGFIDHVQVGGEHAWYMLGHTFWSHEFSARFLKILLEIYDLPETADLLWESIYMKHLDVLKMKIRKYPNDAIFEFDTLDELRVFDPSYVTDTRSVILKQVATELSCLESDICDVRSYKDGNNAAAGIRFLIHGNQYEYTYQDKQLRRMES
jgi:hypothetical protein